jgi:hypothetical protein
VGLAFAARRPRLFMKRADGRLPFLSNLLFWPYYALNGLGLLLSRFLTREGRVSQVLPGLYLGPRLTWLDRPLLRSLKPAAVLDLTCELGECAELRGDAVYRCIPLLDTYAPDAKQLEEGVRFLTEHHARGPVYVHCALGHGRSALFVCAYLVASGHFPDVEAALAHLRAKRPGVSLNAAQRACLESHE